MLIPGAGEGSGLLQWVAVGQGAEHRLSKEQPASATAAPAAEEEVIPAAEGNRSPIPGARAWTRTSRGRRTGAMAFPLPPFLSSAEELDD